MIRIEHVAVWVTDLDAMRRFYEKYFGAVSGPKYQNKTKKFESCFLTFSGGARLELMKNHAVRKMAAGNADRGGFAHIALSVGSKEKVDGLTRRLKDDGFSVMIGPRLTGDGCYESVVLDPEDNRFEITI